MTTQRVEKLTGNCESWREIGQKDNPSFTNSWANIGAPYNNAAFYKDKFNRVFLRGVIDTGSTGTAAFTLPVGYRPDGSVGFVTWQTGGGPGPGGQSSVVITSAGVVTPTFTGGADIGMDGISWRV